VAKYRPDDCEKISPFSFGHFRWLYGKADQWVRSPARGFLLVFYSNQSPKIHRFELRGVEQTDRRTLKKGKGSPYSIAERRVPELIPVLGSQPAGDVSHIPGGKLPLLSARLAVTLATLKRAATSFAAW